MRDSQERQQLLETACKKLFDEIEDTVKQFKDRGGVSPQDDFDKIHIRTLFITQVESELSYLQRSLLTIRHEVEVAQARAKAALEDKESEVMSRPTFKNPMGYMSRPELEAKMRSMTIEATADKRIWDLLMIDVNYLQEVLKSYQQEAYRERRDIDTRLKILGMRF